MTGTVRVNVKESLLCNLLLRVFCLGIRKKECLSRCPILNKSTAKTYNFYLKFESLKVLFIHMYKRPPARNTTQCTHGCKVLYNCFLILNKHDIKLVIRMEHIDNCLCGQGIQLVIIWEWTLLLLKDFVNRMLSVVKLQSQCVPSFVWALKSEWT